LNVINEIFVEGTKNTPQVDFSHLTGELILQGRSIPEDAAKVYEPLLEWANDYINSPKTVTNLRLNLEYFNTASLVWITKLIKILCKINKDESILFIHIYFDITDFDNMDAEELKDIVGALVDNISDSKMSIGIKTYGTRDNGEIVKESLVFI
jgi:hypothetical protein